MEIPKPYLLFIGDVQDDLAAKTARGIVDWRPDDAVGQLRLPGCKADLGIPEISIEEACARGAKTFLIGSANSGGVLPAHWNEVVLRAIHAGMNVASGLHIKLSAIAEIDEAARAKGVELFDVRHPKDSLATGTGIKRRGKRMLCVGTDCSCGKMYTALAVERELLQRGAKASFRATGQTGILIAGQGIAIDAVVADFIAGAVEKIAPENDADHWDIIEGQGSLFHAAFAGVSMGLIHGSQPDALVLCHEPTRQHMRGLKHMPLPGLRTCIDRNLEAASLTNPGVKFVASSINTANLGESAARDYLAAVEDELGVPATDPFRFGASSIADALLAA